MITYDVYQLKVEQFGLKNYIYLVVDNATNKTAIVDPSWNYSTVLKLLDKLNVKIDIILLTHSHIDHTYMTNTLTKRYINANVYMSDIECRYYKYSTDNLVRIHNNDVIRLGETDVTCILTPGHTKGSMCYLLQESLFTGDTIFIEGCGICTASGGDAYDMYNSIQKIKNIVQPHVRIYAGHSYGRQQGERLKEVLKHNIYFQIDDAKIFVDFRNRKDQRDLFKFK